MYRTSSKTWEIRHYDGLVKSKGSKYGVRSRKENEKLGKLEANHTSLLEFISYSVPTNVTEPCGSDFIALAHSGENLFTSVSPLFGTESRTGRYGIAPSRILLISIRSTCRGKRRTGETAFALPGARVRCRWPVDSLQRTVPLWISAETSR